MKRNIIHFFYKIFKNPFKYLLACLIFIGVYALCETSLLKFVEHLGYDAIGAHIIWSIGMIILFFCLGWVGHKIEKEKKEFTECRDTLKCSFTSFKEKNKAAEKMLQSEELDLFALHEIIRYLMTNTPTHDKALEKLSEMNKIPRIFTKRIE